MELIKKEQKLLRIAYRITPEGAIQIALEYILINW